MFPVLRLQMNDTGVTVMVGDRCSPYSDYPPGLYKSTFYIYIPDAGDSGRPRNTQRPQKRYGVMAAVNDGYLLNESTSHPCRVCGNTRRGRDHHNHNHNNNHNNNHHHQHYHPSSTRNNRRTNDGLSLMQRQYFPSNNRHYNDANGSAWSRDRLDTNNNPLVSSGLRLGRVSETISLCANVNRGTECVGSVLEYKDNRRYKNHILVTPGLCPCPSAFAESNFLFLTNTHKRFKNRVLLHSRQFKTVRRSETVCISPKSPQTTYTTTLNQDLNPHPPAWHATKLEFVPGKYRSVYHIGFSSNRGGDNNSDKSSKKFSFKKWQLAEINNAFSQAVHLGLNASPPRCRPRGGKSKDESRDCIGERDEVEDGDTGNNPNCNHVIITNVINCPGNEPPSGSHVQAKHRYFTMEQN